MLRNELKIATAFLALLGASATANANPVDVSYTISGSADNWVYDFSVTNNIVANNVSPGYGTFGIFKFATDTNACCLQGSSSPTGWPQTGAYFSGPDSTTYNNSWTNPAPYVVLNTQVATGILPGQTLSGFILSDPFDTTPVLSFNWTVYAQGPGDYKGPDNVTYSGQAGDAPIFDGTATATLSVPSGVPEPSTWAMMLLGFAGIGFMAYRRKSKPPLLAV
jgi:hypothetical protein